MRRTLRLGFFTRLLDEGDAALRYRLATEQIIHAERCNFHSAWVAQHHFHAGEGGLPSPLPFLAHVAARTGRIRLGTGIITLPLELGLRVAEDAAVLDLLCDGRLELGVGPGGNPAAFAAFGLDSQDRHRLMEENLALLRAALADGRLPGGDQLYPACPGLAARLWQATFSVEGGRRAGAAGDGLLLSRTQPRPAGSADLPLSALQMPIIEAYRAALPAGAAPRIVASRSVFVADSQAAARAHAETGLARHAAQLAARGREAPDPADLDALIAFFDVHLGTAEAVAASLAADPVLGHATELAVQVHSVDPPHALTLRSITLMATRVAPMLGLGLRGTG